MPEAAAIIRRFDDPDERRDFPLGLGDLFEIGPGHDSVVIGDEPYVSIHFLGADQYGTT